MTWAELKSRILLALSSLQDPSDFLSMTLKSKRKDKLADLQNWLILMMSSPQKVKLVSGALDSSNESNESLLSGDEIQFPLL